MKGLFFFYSRQFLFLFLNTVPTKSDKVVSEYFLPNQFDVAEHFFVFNFKNFAASHNSRQLMAWNLIEIFFLQYLSKQNRLLRQAAESRLRLCEQLEASVAECERAKLRLRHQLDAERQRHIT